MYSNFFFANREMNNISEQKNKDGKIKNKKFTQKTEWAAEFLNELSVFSCNWKLLSLPP